MREDFWEIICGARLLGEHIAVINVVLLALLLVTLPFQEPGTATYVISLLAGAIIVVTLIMYSILRAACKSRRDDEERA